MLTYVQVYSQRKNTPILAFDSSEGSAETDFIQIRNIEGLEPVKATIGSVSLGSGDGALPTGNRIDTRNIVLTLHPNPDWNIWTFESLRNLLRQYFMPQSLVRLIFHSDVNAPVGIYGVVEDFQVNPFSDDQEFVISIICMDPYFTDIDPTIIGGDTNDPEVVIDNEGDLDLGVNLEIDYTSGASTSALQVWTNGKVFGMLSTHGLIGINAKFYLGSIPGNKFVHAVDPTNGRVTDVFPGIFPGSIWPILERGTNKFKVLTNTLTHASWILTYYKRYGGL